MEMRKPCRECDCQVGVIEVRNGQDCVFCGRCRTFQYNAPKSETGREPRTVTRVHNGVKPKQRSRILERATNHCEICGARQDLHVGHLISVARGMEMGLTEADLNSDENLAAMCSECNLGIGDQPVPLRLAIAMVMARVRKD
jgi:hypothetical protein